MNLTGLKAVTLDAAGTLLEPWPSVGEVYARVAEECGIGPVSAGELNRQFAAAWKKKRAFDHSRVAWRRIVEQTFAGLAALKPAYFDHLYDEFAQPRCWRVYEDAPRALESFRDTPSGGAPLKLGIISNWDERLRRLLEQMGLAPYFSAIAISTEVGEQKPAAAIFARAAEMLNLEPNEILHVGDSVTEDFEGARAAGYRSVLLDRSGKSKDAISSLTELLG